MLRSNGPLKFDHLLVSDSKTESDDNPKAEQQQQITSREVTPKRILMAESKTYEKKETDEVIEIAQKYQEYMKNIPIPPAHDTPIPFNSWQELGKSMSASYEQPLHYLTHMILKKWDELKIGTEKENRPIDTINHPNKAEATVWAIEVIRRHYNLTGHVQLAKLWLSDPTYQSCVDPIITDTVESEHA
ncbi:hypothetical protein Dsin_008298 [Dipteronia sinensis]|uniref:Uncharacterized protein n=1 Tax=Dipteronia sinensis TaxID=43782 RepID=A0AAE0EAJ4_9ROSI|nr:hypothetical protein Dsin_008298 [Dipteronia sinensis]